METQNPIEIENNELVNGDQNESEKGASMVEYALLIVLIALIAMAALALVGQRVSATFSNIGSALN